MALEIVRFQDKYLRRYGESPPIFYRDQEIEYTGSMPNVWESIYFLRRGELFDDPREWGKITYHIPQVSRKFALDDIYDLSLDFSISTEKMAGADRRTSPIYLYTVSGSYEDERGKAVVKALSYERGKIDKIAYTFV